MKNKLRIKVIWTQYRLQTDYRARNQASGLVTTAFRALPITDMAWLMTLGQK